MVRGGILGFAIELNPFLIKLHYSVSVLCAFMSVICTYIEKLTDITVPK